MNRPGGISDAGKYVALTRYLGALPTRETTITLSFRDLESILMFPLPRSAREHRPWWANQTNNAGRAQARGWMNAGYVVDSVNISAGTVRFSRNKGPTACSMVPVATSAAADVAVTQPQSSAPGSDAREIDARRSVDSGKNRRIALISCSAKKAKHKAQAQYLYVSPLFRRVLAYAQFLHPDEIYILSAKYGLLELTTEADPYDLTLNDMSSNDARAWAARVVSQLAQKTDLKRDAFILLAGAAYRRFVVPELTHWEAPLANLPIGKQLQRLDELLYERRL